VSWKVVTTHHFDRGVKALRRHGDFARVLVEANRILSTDPYHHAGIRKLTDVGPEEGNYRLRLGRWRIRYSIHEEVVLHDCVLRREDSY
jgi:mRNA-degrading endonuclease RelE of RelBE toxin-antitoxin system